jgi:hypothetical protein
MNQMNTNRWLAAVLFLALAVRIWGCWFGLPDTLYLDEGYEITRAINLALGELETDRIGKGVYFYVIFIEFMFLFIVYRLFGIVSNMDGHIRLFVENPTVLYCAGRVTTALLGTLSVYLIYRIGRKCFTPRTAIFAAAFLAFSVLHVRNSQYITVDVPMTFFLLLSFNYLIDLLKDDGRNAYLRYGISTGCAIATKLPSILITVPFLLVHFTTEKKWTNILLTAGAILITICILEPAIVLRNVQLVKEIAESYSSGIPGPVRIDSPFPLVSVEARGNLPQYYLDAILESSGMGVFVLITAGFLYSLWRAIQGNGIDLYLLSFSIPYVILIANPLTTFGFSRYLVPLIPFLVLLTARLLDDLLHLFAKRLQRKITLPLLFLLLAQPGARIVLNDITISHKDTRTCAREWVESTIPNGSVILTDIQKIYYPGKAWTLEQKILNKYFRVEVIGKFSEWNDCGAISEKGIDYIVIFPHFWERLRKRKELWEESQWKDANRFYRMLDSCPRISRIKEFTPKKYFRPGPRIYIYKIY